MPDSFSRTPSSGLEQTSSRILAGGDCLILSEDDIDLGDVTSLSVDDKTFDFISGIINGSERGFLAVDVGDSIVVGLTIRRSAVGSSTVGGATDNSMFISGSDDEVISVHISVTFGVFNLSSGSCWRACEL